MNKQRSWVRAATAALVCLGLSGCYKATFIRDAGVVGGEEHDQWSTFFLFGLIGTEEVDVKEFCPDGDAAVVRTGANFGTSLVSAVTVGIYTPRKVYVTCAKAGAASADVAPSKEARHLELEVDESGRPVHGQLVADGEVRPVEIAAAGERGWSLSVQGGSL
jgi:Bor protein